MSASPSSPKFPLITNCLEVEIMDMFKILKIHISGELKWEVNIDHFVNKASDGCSSSDGLEVSVWVRWCGRNSFGQLWRMSGHSPLLSGRAAPHSRTETLERKGKLAAYSVKRVAASVHLRTPSLFELAIEPIEPTTAWAAVSSSSAETRYSLLVISADEQR